MSIGWVLVGIFLCTDR
jgi:hypothetical protein